MDSEILTALIGTFSGLGGTWLGAYLNRKSAYQTALQLVEIEQHKYTQDRLWDAKKEAYTQVIVSLNAMRKTAATMEDYAWGETAEPDRYFSNPLYKEHTDEFWASFRAVKALFENNALIFSEEFLTLHDNWERELLMYDEDEEPYMFIKVHHDAMSRFHRQFVELAKSEISPAPKATKG